MRKRRTLWVVIALMLGVLPFYAAQVALGALPALPQGAAHWAQGTASRTPSPTLPPTVTLTATPPAPPATPTLAFTDTPGPYEYVVQAGDTCWDIAYRFGHFDPAAIGAIEAANGEGTCSALREGATILVPRPTPTATPVGADLTQTAVATAAPPMITLQVQQSFAVQDYSVQSGDTLSSIAIRFDSSLQQICELNPLPDGIDCGACTWESPNCCCTRPIVLSEGQMLNVPAPTPTPTYTPTFTGSETPTYTPTYRAPAPIFPQADDQVRGPLRLTWLSVGPLAADEAYLVALRDENSGAVFAATTRQLSLDVPPDFLGAGAAPREFVWQVRVVRLGAADGLLYPLGGVVPEQPFTWEGWAE